MSSSTCCPSKPSTAPPSSSSWSTARSRWSTPSSPASAVDHQRDDVLLDEGKDVAVAVAADLVEDPFLVVAEAADRAGAGYPLGQEWLIEVEVPAPEAVV
jgi:hypothetical protein